MGEDIKTTKTKAVEMTDHLTWVNTAKGIGIVLVVFGHVLVGLNGAGLIYDKKMYLLIFNIIYSFHMPLFFFLSGLFFIHSYTKRGALLLIGNKTATIIYPFVIWSTIQIIIEASLANYTNNDESFSHLLTMFLYPKSQFWFLHALFLMFVFNILLFTILKQWAVWIATLITVCLFVFQDQLFANMVIIDNVTRNLIYFNTGIVWAYVVKSLRPGTTTVILFVTFFVVLIYREFIWIHIPLSEASLLFVLAAALTGIGMIIAMSMHRYNLLERSMKVFGRYSMEIFIMHILFASGIRIVLQKFFGIQEFWLHLLIGMLAGLLLPLAVLYMINRFHLHFLLQPPRWMSTKL